MPAPRSLCDTSSPNLSDETILSLAMSRVRKDDFLNVFSRRSFWNRAWILQELVLPKQVVFLCGRATIPLSDVDDVNFWFGSLPLPPSPLPVSIRDWQYLRNSLELAFRKPIAIINLIVRLNDLLSSE
jgi:hypothetical protein